MAAVSKIEGVPRLLQQLSKLLKEAKEADTSYAVGYSQHYAVYVHENLDAAHAPGKEAKYLEGPARKLQNSGEFSRIITKTYKRTGSISQGLLLCALRLLRDSQQIVPIDTGALKASGFVRKE